MARWTSARRSSWRRAASRATCCERLARASTLDSRQFAGSLPVCAGPLAPVAGLLSEAAVKRTSFEPMATSCCRRWPQEEVRRRVGEAAQGSPLRPASRAAGNLSPVGLHRGLAVEVLVVFRLPGVLATVARFRTTGRFIGCAWRNLSMDLSSWRAESSSPLSSQPVDLERRLAQMPSRRGPVMLLFFPSFGSLTLNIIASRLLSLARSTCSMSIVLKLPPELLAALCLIDLGRDKPLAVGLGAPPSCPFQSVRRVASLAPPLGRANETPALAPGRGRCCRNRGRRRPSAASRLDWLPLLARPPLERSHRAGRKCSEGRLFGWRARQRDALMDLIFGSLSLSFAPSGSLAPNRSKSLQVGARRSRSPTAPSGRRSSLAGGGL